MAYPLFREDFEGSLSIPSTVVDISGIYIIHNVAADAFTGNHSIYNNSNATANVITSLDDNQSGNITASVYFKNATSAGLALLQVRAVPSLWVNDCYLTQLATGGLQIKKSSGGSTSGLSSLPGGISFSFPTGIAMCIELRANGNQLTACVIRQDTGQYFINSGTTGGWQTSVARISGIDGFYTTSGRVGILNNLSLTNPMYYDDLIYDPAIPSIDINNFTLTNSGSTQQLTAGGFTDPLFGVRWYSSNTAIATVGNTNGIVTPVSNGSFSITASGRRDASQSASVNGTVALANTITNGNIFTVAKTFPSGLSLVATYTVYNSDGSTYKASTNSGVVQIGRKSYGTNFSASPTGSYLVEWFDGTSGVEYDKFTPLNAIVYGYNSNQDPASWVLSNGNANKLNVDSTGGVLLQTSQPGVTIPTVTNVTNLSALTGVVDANVVSISGIPAVPLLGVTASITGTVNANINLNQPVSPTGNIPETVGDALNAARVQTFGPWTVTQIGATGLLISMYSNGGLLVHSFQLPVDFSSNLNPTRRY